MSFMQRGLFDLKNQASPLALSLATRKHSSKRASMAAAMSLASMAMFAPKMAEAQTAAPYCVEFSSGTAAKLRLSLQSAPRPTGTNQYQYEITSPSTPAPTGAAATLTVGSTSYPMVPNSSAIIQVNTFLGNFPPNTPPGTAIVSNYALDMYTYPAPSFAELSAHVSLYAPGVVLPGGPFTPLSPASKWPILANLSVFKNSVSQDYPIDSIIDCNGIAPVPAKSLGNACNISGGCAAGDPINVATGNVFETVTDYESAGINKLSFTRYYNSASNITNSGTSAKALGVNWRSNYDRSLTTTITSALAERADGQALSFNLVGGVWVSDSDVDIKLTKSGTTWTLTDKDDTVETYSANSNGKAQLTSIQLRNGYTQNLTYNGGLQSVTDSYNRSLTFTYSGGLLQTMTTPDSLVITYGYDASGVNGTTLDRLKTVSYNTSPTTSQTYLYETSTQPFTLTGVTDENGTRSNTWAYDSYGRGTSSQNAGGANLTSVSYNDTTGTRTVTNALGQPEVYTFTTLQGVPKLSQISRTATATTAAATRTFGYDANGYTNSQTDWNGNLTTYVNNSRGLPTTINEAVGSPVARTTTISYDPTFVHEPYQIVTLELTSTFAYDAKGNPATRTDLDTTTTTQPYSTNGQTRTTTWTWSTTGQELSEQLPRTDVVAKTTFGYATDGALIQITDALSHQTNITAHKPGGLPLTIVDPNSVTTTLTYNTRLDLTSSTVATAAGNRTTTWGYDKAKHLTSTQLPDASSLTNTYDGAYRVTKVTDNGGSYIAYTLDALGDRTLEQTANSAGTVRYQHGGSFDTLGRRTQDLDGYNNATVITYDNNSQPLTVAPPSPSGTITYTYDALKRLATRTDPSPGGTTTTTYDAHDRVKTVQDANGYTTAYTYNGFGDRIRYTPPVCCVTDMRYDADSNMTQIIRPGTLTENNTFDALDRPLATSYPNDSTLNISRNYDQTTGHGFGVGRLTSATDQAGSIDLTYDERANVTNESRVMTGAGTLNTATTYDAVSRISGITYPSGTVVAYARNIVGRVSSITAKPPGASAASTVVSGLNIRIPVTPWGPNGPTSDLTYGNGVVGGYTTNLNYDYTSHQDNGTAGTINRQDYTFYANNSTHTVYDSTNSANSQTLGYDSMDRLTSASSNPGGYGAYSWTWDPVGNVKTQTISGTATTFSLITGKNELSQMVTGSSTTVFSDSASGNIQYYVVNGSTVNQMPNNQANRMSLGAGTGGMKTYTYDLFGQRVKKVTATYGTIATYQYARTGELLAEKTSAGTGADYIYLDPGQPRSVVVGEVNPTTGALYFVHTDKLGTPQKVTDSTQAIVWSATYRPFGDTQTQTGSITQNLRMPGQYYDVETGFNHNGFRDYAAGLTRYLQQDPIGLAGGMNIYQYANNNPYKYTDPKGLTAFKDSGLVAWAVDHLLISPNFEEGKKQIAKATFPNFWNNSVVPVVGDSQYGPFLKGVIAYGACIAAPGNPGSSECMGAATQAQAQDMDRLKNDLWKQHAGKVCEASFVSPNLPQFQPAMCISGQQCVP